MAEPLPRLMDRGMVAEELFGLPVAECRASVDAIFAAVPTVVIPDLRKPFVRRVDVEALLEDGVRTWTDGKVA